MFATKDQKATILVKLLVEVVPMIGVPEALLSDQGINLLSHLITDLSELLWVDKINATA